MKHFIGNSTFWLSMHKYCILKEKIMEIFSPEIVIRKYNVGVFHLAETSRCLVFSFNLTSYGFVNDYYYLKFHSYQQLDEIDFPIHDCYALAFLNKYNMK